MIIAIDFDGTLCNTPWPEAYPEDFDMVAVYVLKQFKKNGGRLILWTCRNNESLDKAIKACEKVGLTFDAVNSNDPQHIEIWEADHGKCNYSPKIHADLYIDDKATIAYEIPWMKIHNHINGFDDERKFYQWASEKYLNPETSFKLLELWERYSGRKVWNLRQMQLCNLPLEPFKLFYEETYKV